MENIKEAGEKKYNEQMNSCLSEKYADLMRLKKNNERQMKEIEDDPETYYSKNY